MAFRALRESLVEVTNRISTHVPDHPTVSKVAEFLSGSSDTEFIATAKEILLPVSGCINVNDMNGIATRYPDAGVLDVYNAVPEAEREHILQALKMSTMLINTLSIVPPEMLGGIESMTNGLMNMMSGAAPGGASSGQADLGSMFGALMSGMGGMPGMPGMPSLSNDTGNSTTVVKSKKVNKKKQRRATQVATHPRTTEEEEKRDKFRRELC